MYCKSCGRVIADGTDYCNQCAESVPSVTMGEALKLYFSNYSNFKGRSRRSEYWKGGIAVGLISGLISSLAYLPMMTGEESGLAFSGILSLVALIWSLVIFLPSLALVVRRLHDTGHSGWCYFCSLIPLVGGILIFVWMCTDSTEANQWGPNPKFKPIRRQMPQAPQPAKQIPVASQPAEIPLTAVPTAQHRMPESNPVAMPMPAATPAFSATLILCTGPMSGRQYTYHAGDKAVFGRSKACDVLLTGYEKVSGTHCRIEVGYQKVTVTDLGSTNGTKVGSQRLTANVPVQVPHGGVIFLADNNCAFQVK